MPLTSTCRIPGGSSLVRRSPSAGRSRRRRWGPGATVAGSKTRDVGRVARPQVAPALEPEHVGGLAGQLPDGPLERHDLPLPDPGAEEVRGAGASHSWSTWAPASVRPSTTWSSVSRRSTSSTSSLAMYGAEPGGQVLGEGQLAHDVQGADVALVGDVGDPAAQQLGVPLGLGHFERVPARPHAALVSLQVFEGPGSPLLVSVGRLPHLRADLDELAEDLTDIEVVGIGQGELHGQRPGVTWGHTLAPRPAPLRAAGGPQGASRSDRAKSGQVKAGRHVVAR